MSEINGDKEFTDFYKLVSDVLQRLIRGWNEGEFDIVIEGRNDGGTKKAKIKGGEVTRIE